MSTAIDTQFKRIHIPWEWSMYAQRADVTGCFFLDSGEIRVGIPYQFPGFEDRICIVQKDKWRDAQKLISERKGLISEEDLEPFGYQVFDIATVKRVCEIEEIRGISVKSNHFGADVRNSKKTFVFGAGASSFCVFGDEAEAYRQDGIAMPLGVELFNRKYREIRKKYRGADLSTSMFKASNNDIETCLEHEWLSCNMHNAAVLSRHVNIQFYMQELFTELSKAMATTEHYENRLYQEFARKLNNHLHGNNTLDKKEKVINLINFNYDTLLEDALNDFFPSHKIDAIDRYCDVPARKVDVFKPHGSCNWGWPFRNENIKAMPAKEVIDQLLAKNITPYDIYFDLLGYGQEAIAENSFGLEKDNNPDDIGKFALNRDLMEVIPQNAEEAYVPALLIPYRDKDELVMPYRHQAVMNTALRNTEELVLIGWKGNERIFNHKLKTYADAVNKITIVCPKRDKAEVIANLERDLKVPLPSEKIALNTAIETFEEYVIEHMDNHLKN